VSSVVWVKRQGGTRDAHALIDGEPVCPPGRMVPGTVTPYQGRTVKPFIAIIRRELTADGWPYGPVCTMCMRRVRIALGLSVHRSLNPSTPNPPVRS
jgi:hypothetical protein